MARGVLITFEGGEGTGKSTQLRSVAARLREHGREVVTTREPGGTPLAEGIRRLLLDPVYQPDGVSELLLLEAARHDLVTTVIRPALERGAVVLSDRFADSSTVYQGLVRGLEAELVEQLNAVATGGLVPDLTVVLDLPAELGVARARSRNGDRGDRLDAEDLAFHRKVREGFLSLAAAAPGRVAVILAEGEPEVVLQRVLKVVAGVLDA